MFPAASLISADPGADRPSGRGCWDFLPRTASEPGICLPFLLLIGAQGECEPSAGWGLMVLPQQSHLAGTQPRGCWGVSGLSWFAHFSRVSGECPWWWGFYVHLDLSPPPSPEHPPTSAHLFLPKMPPSKCLLTFFLLPKL